MSIFSDPSDRKRVSGKVQLCLIQSCRPWNEISAFDVKFPNREILPEKDWRKNKRILTGFLTMCLIGPKWWEFGLHEKIIKLAWGLPILVIHEAAEHAQTLANQRFVRYFAIDCISTTKFRSFFKKIEATRFIKINPEFRAATDDEIDDFIIKVAFSIDSI